jgi:hypothetical protein
MLCEGEEARVKEWETVVRVSVFLTKIELMSELICVRRN